MTIKRAEELARNALEIGKQISLEASIAVVSKDTKKLSYLKQELIVLKKILHVIEVVTMSYMEDNEEI